MDARRVEGHQGTLMDMAGSFPGAGLPLGNPITRVKAVTVIEGQACNLSWSSKPYNWLLGTYTQHQAAAPRQVLRAGQRQR